MDSRRLVFTTILAQLKVKKDVISELNDNISVAIKNEDELETELTDADFHLTELEEKIAIVEEFIKKASQPPVIRDISHTLTPHPPSLAATVAPPMPETEVVKRPIHTTNVDSAHGSDELVNLPINTSQTAQDSSHTFSRLPKLTLPTFNGSPLQWQTFWDTFKAGVDSNPNLSHVQKFAYLHAQLEGDAARVIGGFPLTDDNYVPAVTLLQERFGKQFKIVDAHMDALLNVPAPSNTLNSLQSFYDTIQSHKRSLSTLGKSTDSYGTLLTSVILGKLPSDTKARMVRDHYDTEWTIDELMASILKEIRIFEAGQHSSQKTTSVPTTTSFHMAANKGTSRERPKKDPTCVFCKGMHKPNLCTMITSPKSVSPSLRMQVFVSIA